MMQHLTQEVKNTITEMVQGLHTAIPGKIIKYDPVKCEAEVLPYGKFKKPDGSFLDFPQLNHVPIYFMQAMGQKLTVVYAIKPGDECLILSQEQTLDTWRGSGAESNNDLRFDLTNSIAIVGLFSKPNELCQRAQDNESIIVQREDTFIEMYDGKIETKVRHKETAVDSYYLMVDAIADTAMLSVKSNSDDKETVKINIDGNEGKINLVTTNTEQNTETIKAELYGQQGTASISTKNIGTNKEVLKLDFDGSEGDVTVSTTNYSTNNGTTSLALYGQKGQINLTAKNKETGTATTFIQMDGAGKSITVQGYVTVLGSHAVVPMEIPD
jgi:hypothetical protein